MTMKTAYERYREHKVWETLKLKRDALAAARYDSAAAEEGRIDILGWLDEARKTRNPRQPALYLTVLDQLSEALNQLPVDTAGFARFLQYRRHPGQAFDQLEQALRALPLPLPKDISQSYVALLDEEVDARTSRLDQLEVRIAETETALSERLRRLAQLSTRIDELSQVIETEQQKIAAVSESADSDMRAEWESALSDWWKDRRKTDSEHDEKALTSISTLAAVAVSGQELAEHAAGDLSATDWYGRSSREREAASRIRVGAWLAFLAAGAVGYYIVHEAITKNFDISLGGGILRASVAIVIGALGALLLRESGRHFREADTAEDVALSLKALAPFYANSGDDTKLAARNQVGDAVLVKNVLSRFSHRDAAKHAGDASTAELSKLVEDATAALKNATSVGGRNAD